MVKICIHLLKIRVQGNSELHDGKKKIVLIGIQYLLTIFRQILSIENKEYWVISS